MHSIINNSFITITKKEESKSKPNVNIKCIDSGKKRALTKLTNYESVTVQRPTNSWNDVTVATVTITGYDDAGEQPKHDGKLWRGRSSPGNCAHVSQRT